MSGIAGIAGWLSQDLEMVKVLLAFGADPLKAIRFTGLRRSCEP